MSSGLNVLESSEELVAEEAASPALAACSAFLAEGSKVRGV